MPSPPATTSRSGAAPRRARAVPRSRTASRPRRARASLHERLGVEPPARGPVGDQRDVHGRPGFRLPRAPFGPNRCPGKRAISDRLRGPSTPGSTTSALAVADLDAALALHERTYGMPLAHRETVTEQGVEAVLLDVGENHVELLRPLADDTPVGKFLAQRGPGLHHVAYQVADIEAALARLREQGVRLIDEVRRARHPRTRVAFLHPSASGSVLTELVQPATLHA